MLRLQYTSIRLQYYDNSNSCLLSSRVSESRCCVSVKNNKEKETTIQQVQTNTRQTTKKNSRWRLLRRAQNFPYRSLQYFIAKKHPNFFVVVLYQYWSKKMLHMTLLSHANNFQRRNNLHRMLAWPSGRKGVLLFKYYVWRGHTQWELEFAKILPWLGLGCTVGTCRVYKEGALVMRRVLLCKDSQDSIP